MAAAQPDEVPSLVVVNGIASTSPSETESQPPNIPQTPQNSDASSSPNSNNNNAIPCDKNRISFSSKPRFTGENRRLTA
ncbi:unnamed protein product, partial [Rotaria sp. Silwood2]